MLFRSVGASIDKAMASRDLHQNIVVDHRILYADGGIGYVSARFNVDKDEQGNLLRYYGANQDITERHLADEALRASEKQLADAMTAARIANWEFDAAKGEFVFNDRYYALLHTTAEKEGGYRMTPEQYGTRFVHPEDNYLVGESFGRVLASKELHNRVVLEHRILYADGGVGFVSVRLDAEKDEHGNLLNGYGATQDITDRWQADEALRTSERQLAEAMNVAHIANWEFDFVKGEFVFNDPFYASPIIAGDKVYMLDRSGIMHIVSAGPAFKLIAESPLGERADCTPAFSEKKIYIRGKKNLYCIGEN